MAGRSFDSYTDYEASQGTKLDPIPEGGDDDEYHPCKSQRTDRLRLRLARRESPDLDISDFSESEEETSRGRNKRKASSGRGGKSKPVLTDEDGNVLSPAEAKRVRKRATNRESARRMRLQRKEEHNTLQQEVHSKTVALSRATQMNARINQDYSRLVGENHRMVGKIHALEASQAEHLLLQVHSNTMDAAVRQFCGAMLAGLGGEVDNAKLREFLAVVAPLLGSSSKAKAATPNTINITANSTGASFKGLQVAKILPDAETPRCYVEQSNRHYHSDDSPLASLAESYHAKMEDLDRPPTGVATAVAPVPPPAAESRELALPPGMEGAPFPTSAPMGGQGVFGIPGGMGGLHHHGDMHSQLDSLGYPRHQQQPIHPTPGPVIRLDGTSGSGAGLWSTNSFSSMDQLLLSKQLSVGSLDFNSWVQAAEHIDGLPKGGC